MGKDFVKVLDPWSSLAGFAYRGLALGLAALVWGCAATAGDVDTGEGDDEEPIATTSEALTTLATYTDPTGNITVTYYVCGWSAAGPSARTSCTVPSTDALVGGGAEIEGDNPDAMLVGSYPAGTRTWFAESKTFLIPTNHRVRARAMGLRLSGLSGSALRSLLMTTSKDAASSIDSVAVAGPPMSNTVLVGGGATILSGEGNFLYETDPNIPCLFCQPNGWLAASRAHAAAPTGGRVRAYGLWLPQCPSGFAGGCLTSSFGLGSITSPDGGYISVREALPSSPSSPLANHVLTSLGGWAHAPDGDGRFLATLYPYWSPSAGAPAGRVATKDHLFHDPGRLTVLFLMGLAVAE